jgi:hypothetical protein
MLSHLVNAVVTLQATTLRKVSKMTKEYMPEVGEVCEFYLDGKWEVITVQSITFLMVNFTFDDSKRWEFLALSRFRPIKTQQDIEREEAIHSLVKIIKDDYKTDAVLAARILNSGYVKVGDEVGNNSLFMFNISKHHAEILLKNFKIYPRGDV